jgi:Cu/Ag efflux pump CusA
MEEVIGSRAVGQTTYDAVLAGARRRLRPVLMTACVRGFSFIPMALQGADEFLGFPLAATLLSLPT